MNLKLVNVFAIVVLVLFFEGCSFSKDNIKSVVQTNSAVEIVKYKNEIVSTLIEYKKKLDVRNPYSYNKILSKDIIKQIEENQDYINIIQDKKKLKTYDEYLHYALLDKDIANRNDFLIIGLYKLIYKAYSLQDKHKFTALEHNKFELLKLYEYMQVLRWKIRTQKDVNGNYLFNTWQNNWQLEFLHKDKNDLNIIKDLQYIKSNKETILSPSNFSFEILFSKMILNVEYTLKKINIEPYSMSASAIRSFIFIL